MEVKPGYKQTEVGVIPEEWTVRKLGNLLKQPRSVRYGIVQPGKFYPSGCLMLRSQDYSKGWTERDEMHRVSPQLEKQYRNARIQRDDLIMTVVGAGIGQVVVAPSWLDGAILSRSTARIAVDDNLASRMFVKASLESPVGKRQILDCQKEGAQPVVSCQDLAKFFIPFPPRPEQRAIAEALSDVDGLLGGLDRLIAKKRDLKWAAMQQLLTGKKRLTGFHGEWEVKTLDQVGRCFAGGTPSTYEQDYWGGDIYWLPSGRIQNNILASPGDSEVTITRRGLDESAAKRIKPKSVLVAITGATCANVGLLQFEAAANQSVVAIETYNGTDATFLFYALLMERGQMLSRQSGSAQGGVNLKNVKKIEVNCPSYREQTAIAEVLSDMELAALEQRRDKTRVLKQGMMQELLTGRTRLV